MSDKIPKEIPLEIELKCAHSMQEQFEIVERKSNIQIWKKGSPLVRPGKQ